MPNTSGLKRGGPGRPKGVPNRATREGREFARDLLGSESYRQRLRQQADNGRLSPTIEALLWAYAYGKPKDTIDLNQRGTLIVKWADSSVATT